VDRSISEIISGVENGAEDSGLQGELVEAIDKVHDVCQSESVTIRSKIVRFELTHVVVDAGSVDNIVSSLIPSEQEDICPIHAVGTLTLG
jgi:hypothetical protein